jgi:Cu+-exporting ATPase
MTHCENESARKEVPVTEPCEGPVCGMMVDPRTADHHVKQNDVEYYFCSSSCRDKFVQDRAKYLERAAEIPKEGHTAARIAEYTCPMHPEVKAIGPGDCSKCGMSLEPSIPLSSCSAKTPSVPE